MDLIASHGKSNFLKKDKDFSEPHYAFNDWPQRNQKIKLTTLQNNEKSSTFA